MLVNQYSIAGVDFRAFSGLFWPIRNFEPQNCDRCRTFVFLRSSNAAMTELKPVEILFRYRKL